MNFEHTPKVKELINEVSNFMDENIYPAEEIYANEMKAFRDSGNPWQVPKIIEELKLKARKWFWLNQFGICSSSRDHGQSELCLRNL